MVIIDFKLQIQIIPLENYPLFFYFHLYVRKKKFSVEKKLNRTKIFKIHEERQS